MAFLPFHVPGAKTPRVLIVGGGYAGLAALVSLRRHRPEAEITLVDPRSQHIKITHLHETFRRPLEAFRVPFADLGEQLGFRHVQAEVRMEDEDLRRWQVERCLQLADETLEFDCLLLASGMALPPPGTREGELSLADFCGCSGYELLERHLARSGAADTGISVVGGGATGIQFLFEIAGFLRQRGFDGRLRLIDAEPRVLRQFAPEFGRYVVSRMRLKGIDYLPRTYFRGQQDGAVHVEDAESGQASELPSGLALLFPGQTPVRRLQVNAFGQVRLGGQVLTQVFAAGDQSVYAGPGSNTATAQSAVRKGRLAARNILRHCGLLPVLEPYLHRDLGYVVSLGPDDAVGWLGLQGNVVGGTPALLIKEIVEAQYDLLLSGIDTYFI